MSTHRFAVDAQRRLVGRVRLRGANEQDLATMYGWRVDLAALPFWSAVRRPLTFEAFAHEFQAMASGSILFMFEDASSGRPMGFSQISDISHVDGHASLLFFLAPERRGVGIARYGAYLSVVGHVFRSFPFRKLYADIASFNQESWRSVEKLGWERESVFTNHVWFGGSYWDLYRYALWRETWAAQHAIGELATAVD